MLPAFLKLMDFLTIKATNLKKKKHNSYQKNEIEENISKNRSLCKFNEIESNESSSAMKNLSDNTFLKISAFNVSPINQTNSSELTKNQITVKKAYLNLIK